MGSVLTHPFYNKFLFIQTPLRRKIRGNGSWTWQANGVPRQVVLLLQHIATLVEVGTNGGARKTGDVVFKEGRGWDNHYQLPLSGSSLLSKGLTAERRPALHGVEHLFCGALAVFASGATALSICPAQLHSIL